MTKSKICLISAIVCFAIGAIIFMLALFGRMFDPTIAGGVGGFFIVAFLVLSIANIVFRNKELAEEKK